MIIRLWLSENEILRMQWFEKRRKKYVHGLVDYIDGKERDKNKVESI